MEPYARVEKCMGGVKITTPTKVVTLSMAEAVGLASALLFEAAGAKAIKGYSIKLRD